MCEIFNKLAGKDCKRIFAVFLLSFLTVYRWIVEECCTLLASKVSKGIKQRRFLNNSLTVPYSKDQRTFDRDLNNSVLMSF